MKKRYDVALSFASEQRTYVARVAEQLRERGVRVFYDDFEREDLWGKDLADHFDEIFRSQARYCVVFISAEYAAKVWPKREFGPARDRAALEASEYILPARFDDTRLPGLFDTVRYEDLREREPADFADLICRKLGRPRVASDDSAFVPRWAAPTSVTTGSAVHRLPTYQGIPMRDALPPTVNRALAASVERLADLVRPAEDGCYWSDREDRRFDRLYATAAVSTALAQLGVAHEAPPLAGGIGYLRGTDPAAIDDRAATILRLTIGDLDDEQLVAFVDALHREQIRQPDNPFYGSFLLTQGPTPQNEHWTGRQHPDGHSFHACHLGDVLLHLPAGAVRAREAAEPVLRGIRHYLATQLGSNGGWLVDRSGNRTSRTLYAFALCRALSIPLPRNWLDICGGVFELLAPASVMQRCFGVMNAWYVWSTTQNDQFRDRALTFVQQQIPDLLDALASGRLNAVDVSVAQRALAGTVRLHDPGLVAYTAMAVHSAISDREQHWKGHGHI